MATAPGPERPGPQPRVLGELSGPAAPGLEGPTPGPPACGQNSSGWAASSPRRPAPGPRRPNPESPMCGQKRAGQTALSLLRRLGSGPSLDLTGLEVMGQVESDQVRIPVLEPRVWTLAKVLARLGMMLGLGGLLLLLAYPILRHGQDWREGCDKMERSSWTFQGHVVRGLTALVVAFASWAFAWAALVHRKRPTSSARFIRALRLWLLLGYANSVLKIACLMCFYCEVHSSLYIKWLCIYKGCAHLVGWLCWTLGMTALLRMRVAELEAAQGSGTWSQRIDRYVVWPAVSMPVCMATVLFGWVNSIEHAKYVHITFIVCLSMLSLATVAGIAMALCAYRVALDLAKASASTWAGGLKYARLGLLSTVRWQLGFLVLCGASTMIYVFVYIADTAFLLFVSSSDDIWRLYVPGHEGYEWVPVLREVAALVDVITNELVLLVLSGLVGLRLPWAGSCARRRFRDTAPAWLTGSTEWDSKVFELSRRGVTVEKLLDFYSTLGDTRMPHFDCTVHTTANVVRQAIVPASADSKFGPCAMATVLMEGKCTPAQRMVTHCWDNRFMDLVSAVVADALGLRSYQGLSAWLKRTRIPALKQHLRRAGTLEKSYWICALSVNQHSCICSVGSVDLDPVLGCEEPRCNCGLAKCWNHTPPLNARGESCYCEVNKFDHMMTLLAQENPEFTQVIAVDRSLVLFERAWCMAELFAAHACAMNQVVVALSDQSLDRHTSELENLRVEDMRASREEDKQMILAKIGDPMKFNEALRDMVLDKDTGLLAQRCDAIGTARVIGRLAKRSLGSTANLDEAAT